MPAAPPLEIPGFTRGKFLGKGSFASVTSYTRDSDRKEFAVKAFSKKRLQRQRRGPRRNALQDVQREIAIMKKLNHPNLVNLEMVLDIPEDDQMLLVMEHLGGGVAMGGKMRDMPALAENTARSYFRDGLCGLEYLHANLILHLDLKPENMLLDTHGRLKLVDFGVSKMCSEGCEGDDSASDIITGSVGTPMFWAPECCTSGLSYSGRKVDLWALGVTLYQFLTGRVPFIAKTAEELREKIKNDPVEMPDSWGSYLRGLMEGMFRKDPDERLTMEECKEHPWTIGDMGPLPKLNQKKAKVKVSQEEVRNAYVSIATLVKVVSKMKGLLRRKLKRDLGREIEKRPPRQRINLSKAKTPEERKKVQESLSVWTTSVDEPFVITSELGF